MSTPGPSSSITWMRNVTKFRYRSFDEVLEKIGEFGRYQIFTCLVIQLATIMWAGSYAFISLAMLEPDIRCGNSTDWIKPTHTEYCSLYKNCSPNNLKTSNQLFYSPVQEWLLICDKAYIQDLIAGIYLAGRIFGSFLGGHLGDYVGRKKGFFVAQFFILVSSVMSIASNENWIPLGICQFLNGFMFGIIIVTSYALMFEYTSNKYSLIANASFQYFVGYLVVAGVGALTRDWRYYLIFVNLISAPLLLGYMLFLESPRYLVATGRLHQAAEVLTNMASDRWNNRRVEIWDTELENIPRDDSGRVYTFVHLFSTRSLAIQSILQMLSTFTCSIVSSVFTFSLNAMPGGPFMHFLYYGLLRIWVPMVIVLDFKMPICGRRHIYLSSLAMVGICFAIILISFACGFEATSPLIYITSLIAITVNVSAYYMSVLHITAVVYPTVVRCTAFGTLHITDDVGTLLSRMQFEKFGIDAWIGWPYVICLCFVVLNFIMAWFFQIETKDKKLVDKLDDLKDDRISMISELD